MVITKRKLTSTEKAAFSRKDLRSDGTGFITDDGRIGSFCRLIHHRAVCTGLTKPGRWWHRASFTWDEIVAIATALGEKTTPGIAEFVEKRAS